MSEETLETARLKLRRATPADAMRMAALASDPGVARMTTRIPHPYAVEDAQAFIAGCPDTVFAIDLPEEGLIGMVGFHQATRFGPEIGYWIGRPYWGRGLATEAAKAALKWAKHDWGRRSIVSGHFADNPASGAVLTKAGFLYTGEVVRQASLARGGEQVDCRRMVWLA
jgi:RimJ/RimL family protein N-acetyltransferase